MSLQEFPSNHGPLSKSAGVWMGPKQGITRTVRKPYILVAGSGEVR